MKTVLFQLLFSTSLYAENNSKLLRFYFINHTHSNCSARGTITCICLDIVFKEIFKPGTPIKFTAIYAVTFSCFKPTTLSYSSSRGALFSSCSFSDVHLLFCCSFPNNFLALKPFNKSNRLVLLLSNSLFWFFWFLQNIMFMVVPLMNIPRPIIDSLPTLSSSYFMQMLTWFYASNSLPIGINETKMLKSSLHSVKSKNHLYLKLYPKFIWNHQALWFLLLLLGWCRFTHQHQNLCISSELSLILNLTLNLWILKKTLDRKLFWSFPFWWKLFYSNFYSQLPFMQKTIQNCYVFTL